MMYATRHAAATYGASAPRTPMIPSVLLGQGIANCLRCTSIFVTMSSSLKVRSVYDPPEFRRYGILRHHSAASEIRVDPRPHLSREAFREVGVRVN